MAAYTSTQYTSASNGVASNNRGSWGDPRDNKPASGSGSGIVFPHIKDIIQTAQPNLAADASLNQYLAEAERCFTSSRSAFDFGRPHLAFKDYLTAYEIAINSIPRHREYGFWEHNHRPWLVKYKSLRQKLMDVEGQMKAVRQVIEENNRRNGTEPQTSRPQTVYATSFGVPTSEAAQHDHKPTSPAGPPLGSNDIPPQLRPGPPRPVSKPKPENLQGRPLGQGSTDLSERFARLRTGTSPTQVDPPVLAMPNARDYQSPTRDRPPSITSPISNGTTSPNQVRPSGPREMPPSSKGPSLPPKLPISPSISLPKAPSPTYSPVNVPTTGLQSSSRHAVEGRPPSEKRQTYYNQPTNGPVTLSLLHRPRDEILHPYRPTTPNGVHSAIVPKSKSSEIPHHTMIEPPVLQDYMAKYNVLIVDIRDRTVFDEGHIMASSIICVEPIVLREGLSAEELEDKLVLAPDSEQVSFSRRNEFDIIVYYDQHTGNDAYLKGPPTMTNAPALRAFYDTMYEFNYTKPLKDGRPPALLKGGIDAWTDYLGAHSLARSKTAAMLGTTRPRIPGTGRGLARQRVISSNSRFEVRNRRLRDHKFLDEKELQAWHQQAQQEEVEPAMQQDTSSDGEYVIVEEEPETPSPFVNDMDSFLRRFPSVNDQQSMTMPATRPLTSLQRYEPAPIPAIPTRPAPAIPRPSYSGQAEINQSQAPLARVASSTRAPLYSSAGLARTRKLPRVGLTNFGVTCYMNATLQCLSATIPLSQFFTDRRYEGFIQKNWKGSSGIMPKFYANLIQALWNDDCAGIKPSSFRNFCGRMNREWVIDRQQDAKEFFDFLVDCLHEDLNVNWERSPLRPLTSAEEMQRERMAITQASPIEWKRYEHRDYSFISSLFAGQHASRLRCLACNKTSTTYEAFYSISIEIPRSGVGNIYDCLRSYTKEEKLTEQWKCPYCKCEREATKQIILTRLPQFLVIHFKRFAASKTEKAKKVHTPIEFPLQGLNMDDFVITRSLSVPDQEGKIDLATTPPYIFDAYGVLRHLGNSGDSGHYISIVKDPGRGCWRKFDDERYSDIDPNNLGSKDRLQNAEAYIVFYQRTAAR